MSPLVLYYRLEHQGETNVKRITIYNAILETYWKLALSIFQYSFEILQQLMNLPVKESQRAKRIKPQD